DTLLRREQLLLAGSTNAEALTSLETTLGQLKGALQASPKKEWGSAQNTWPMATALGLGMEERGHPTDVQPTEQHFQAMYEFLYGKIKPSPDDQPKPERLKRALDVRKYAEQVALATNDLGEKEHPYSEQVFPWIQKQIEDADQDRRLGEDLLFASSHSWEEAQQNLSKAEQGYQQAAAVAAEVRDGLKLRDQLLAELPYYARWLTLRPPKNESAKVLADHVKQLAEATH